MATPFRNPLPQVPHLHLVTRPVPHAILESGQCGLPVQDGSELLAFGAEEALRDGHTANVQAEPQSINPAAYDVVCAYADAVKLIHDTALADLFAAEARALEALAGVLRRTY